jgi:hypothetical protein
MRAMSARPQKITFAEMRSSGVRGVLIYCADYRCSHHVAINSDRWPDDERLVRLVPLGNEVERRLGLRPL